MLPNLKQIHEHIHKQGWDSFVEELKKKSSSGLVDVRWDIAWDAFGSDIFIQFEAMVKPPETYFLQICTVIYKTGIGLNEEAFGIANMLDFGVSQEITTCRAGLVDSKWRLADEGQRYASTIWGYVDQEGAVIQFGPFEKQFTYLGVGFGIEPLLSDDCGEVVT